MNKRLCTMMLVLIALLILMSVGLCFARTSHDGKQPMDKFLLQDSIVNGLEMMGYEATPERIALLLETAAAETKCGHFEVPYKQRGSFGTFQITQSTAKDTLEWLRRSDWRLWQNLMENVFDPSESLVDNLIFNQEFSAALAWLVYRRMGKNADISTRETRAALWKRVYNTPMGAGSEAGYLKAARECLDEIH